MQKSPKAGRSPAKSPKKEQVVKAPVAVVDTTTASKNHAKFVLSKRIPTKFATKAGAAVCISDVNEMAFAACGNTIKVYSLRTGI